MLVYDETVHKDEDDNDYSNDNSYNSESDSETGESEDENKGKDNDENETEGWLGKAKKILKPSRSSNKNSLYGSLAGVGRNKW